MAEIVATYSIAACDPAARQWGVATQSKFLGVGSVVPWAEPEVGAIATQAYANPRYGPSGLALLHEGLSADQVVERLTAADEGRDHRQLGVVERSGGYAGLSDEVVDLRVDEHPRPLEELRRIYGMHQAIFGTTPPDEWLDVDDDLANELRDRLAKLGYDGDLGAAFFQWAGKENLEERVDGVERIDPVVLEELRRQT